MTDKGNGMKLEAFESGRWVQQYQYKSFSPVPVNREWSWEDTTINTLLERASRALAELDAFTLIVPDVDRFIQMHIKKEASNSSRIEGTQTEMDEAVLDSSQLAPEKRDDWQEVHNVRRGDQRGDRGVGAPAVVESAAEAHPRHSDAGGAWRAQDAG